MENTSDSFMPRPLLFCLKSGRSVCYSVPDNNSLKHKTLCLLVTLVVFVIFASFSVVNMSRQYSTIHDYYMDSRSTDQEISQSLEELIPKIEVLQSEFK